MRIEWIVKAGCNQAPILIRFSLDDAVLDLDFDLEVLEQPLRVELGFQLE